MESSDTCLGFENGQTSYFGSLLNLFKPHFLQMGTIISCASQALLCIIKTLIGAKCSASYEEDTQHRKQ